MTRCWLSVAAATVLGAGATHAASCDTPLDAALKLNDTPYHMTMSTTGPGSDSETSEIISTDDATYVKVRDVWHPGPKEELTLGDTDIAEAESAMTCQLVRSETVAGTPTDVWRIEDRSDPDELKLQTVWIARDTGLIVRMEIEIDEDGKRDGTHTSAEIDYSDVLPPR